MPLRNGGLGGLTLTPKSRARPITNTSPQREENSFQLSLQSVIGTTTESSNAFDSLQDGAVFAHCAGPAVILSHVDDQLNISQTLYRAKPNAASINTSNSFYNNINTPPNTPSKARSALSLRDGGIGSNAHLASEFAQGSPGTTRAASWHREATCLSLSRNGKYLAVGEVSQQTR